MKFLLFLFACILVIVVLASNTVVVNTSTVAPSINLEGLSLFLEVLGL